jgi:outer membrane protein, adhesin transport system
LKYGILHPGEGRGVIRKFLISIVASACLSDPASAATLAESVSAALLTHPETEASRAAVTGAAQSAREQRAGYFPTLSMSASAGRERAENSTTRGLVGSGATSWTGSHAVTLTQPVFAGFSVKNHAAAAAEREKAAGDAALSVSEDLALRAARAHLNLMRTKELLAAADAYYKEIGLRRDKVALMVKEGAADAAENAQAGDILLAARNTRLGYDEAYRQAEADYIEVVGKKPDAALDFGASSWEPGIPAAIDAAVEAGLAENPAVRAAARAASAAGKDSDAADGERLPRLDAALGYDRKNQVDAMGGNSEDTSAVLRLSWDVSLGGAEAARAARAAAERAGAEARHRAALRQTEHDIRKSFTSMEIVDQQFGLLVEREKAVQDILDSALKQFEAGK